VPAALDEERPQQRRCCRVVFLANAYYPFASDLFAAWIGEIQCRASIRIGELSRELEKAERQGLGSGAGLGRLGGSADRRRYFRYRTSYQKPYIYQCGNRGNRGNRV
jgi:hypothetical protein